MVIDFDLLKRELDELQRTKPDFVVNLQMAFELCEIEIGKLAERVQQQRAMYQPLEERGIQLSRYIDQLIIKNYGPGTYQLDGELWSTEEPK